MASEDARPHLLVVKSVFFYSLDVKLIDGCKLSWISLEQSAPEALTTTFGSHGQRPAAGQVFVLVLKPVLAQDIATYNSLSPSPSSHATEQA